MKKVLLIFFVVSPAWSAGPLFQHNDTAIDQEFRNVYTDLASPKIGSGTASTMTITSLTVSTMTPTSGIIGNTTGALAPVGDYGEYISSVTAVKNCTTSTQYDDYGQITLTAGTWLVWTQADVIQNGATWTGLLTGFSTTSGNSGTGLTNGSTASNMSWGSSATTPAEVTSPVTPSIVTPSASTTYFHKFNCVYSAGGPPTRKGRISALRIY